jgi:hypothetical protein
MPALPGHCVNGRHDARGIPEARAGVGETDAVEVAALDQRRAETERWFVRRGVPQLIEGYNAREDILTRMVPFLALVFLAEVFFALDLDFAWWANTLSFIGAAALLAAAVAGVNHLRGRPPFALPDTIGWPEVAIFVLVPPLLPLVFGGQTGQAVGVLVGNLVLLMLSYLVTSYGVIATVGWALRQLVGQLRNIGPLVARSLPLLLLVTMFMFFNAELWKVVDDLPQGFLLAALAILVFAGSAFVVLFLRGEIDSTAHFNWWSEARDAAADTPVAAVDIDGLGDPPEPPPLSRRGRANVAVVLFFMQAVQILAVTIAIIIFYVVFGMFTVIDTTIEQWTGSTTIDTLVEFDLFGGAVVITEELVRTAIFVGAIAGLQFTVSALTDAGYREQFAAEVTAGLRKVMAVRALYLARLVG